MPRRNRSKWAKKCSKCGKVLGSQNKSLLCEYHYKEAYRKSPRGKELRRKNARKYRNKPGVKEKIKESKKEYNQRPEVKEMRRKYYQGNKEVILEKAKEFYNLNKKKILKKQKEYYENNKERIILRTREYRKMKKLEGKSKKDKNVTTL